MPSLSRPYPALAVVAGLLAALAAGLFLGTLAPALGLVQIDYPRLLGQLGFPEGRLAIIYGWGVFLLGGVGAAWVYAYYLYDRLPGPGWLQGLLFGGIGLFLFSSLAILPLFDLHPLAREGRLAAPGLFALRLTGWKALLANFLGHCLYGLLLGRIYRRKLIF